MVHTRMPDVRKYQTYTERNLPLSGEGAAHLAYSRIGKCDNAGGVGDNVSPAFYSPAHPALQKNRYRQQTAEKRRVLTETAPFLR